MYGILETLLNMIDTCDKTWYFEIMAQRHYD